MANQVIVTNTGNVQVALTPPANVQVQISRAAIGTVTNVPNANTANTVTNNAQPNITSVGTLIGLTSSGNITAPFFLGNVIGNISGNLVVPGTNTAVLFNQLGNAGASDALKFDYSANVLTANGNIVANYYSGNGSQLTGINANYSNFAGEAFDVNVSNITGIGNIATVNLDGNSSNVLYGNGVFATISIPAGDQISNGTSNVSIPVANGNVQVYANNQHWTFTDVGNLLLAGGNGVIQSIANSSLDPINPNVSTMVLTPDQGNNSQALVLDPTTPGHIHLRAPGSNIDQPQANVYLGGEISSFEVGVFNGAVPNLFIHSNNNTWMFDITGNLTLPANTFAVNYANGTQVPLDGPVANANYANFAGTAYSVDGANVSGTVANATFALDAGNSNLANTANSVAVANVSGIGNIATTNYDGNASNVLYGNGGFYALPSIANVANANYANFAGEAFNVNASNITGTVANANYSAYAGEANTANLATFATTANAVAGANVTGTVANATFALDAGNSNLANTANSVAVANVSGIGNIATVNLDGNASNILYGNGVFATTPIISNVANANYANFAGTAYSVSGANVSGEVANANFASYANLASTANLATYATTANAVAGANVSGVVANANYSAYANIAATANSVAVANVSGIGNIATINLDGSSSNVLFGNGVFAPESTSIANANYANFAGTVITNAQPNITSVGILSNLSVTGNVNAGNVNSGVLQAVSSAGGALKNASGASQLQWGAGGGNNLTVDVNININPANGQVDISPTGNGGHVHIKPTGNNAVEIAPTTAGVINNMIIGNVTPQPANVTTLGATGNVTASYFIGNGSSLTSITGGNVSGTVANANYSAYANIAATANSVAVANVSGIGNIATINLDGSSSNVLFGNGVFAPESTSIANANYANFAGDVVNSTQSNITSLGNLINLNVSNAVSNTRSPITQFSPNGITVGLTTNPLAGMLSTDYGSQTSNAQPMNWQWVKARGNSTTTTGAANNDNMMRLLSSVYNGNTYPRSVALTTAAPLAANSSFTGANVVWTPGSFTVTTGNPAGNVTSNSAVSPQNALTFQQTGILTITPGTNSNGGSAVGISITNYGSNSDGSGLNTGTITTTRYRGNRDSQTAVANTDNAGGYFFQAYNGSNTQVLGAFRMFVNTNYGAVSAGQPIGGEFQIQVNGNTGSYITYYNGDGSVVFPNTGNAVVNFVSLNASANANITGNLLVSTTANIANLQLNRFQETVYAIGSTSGTITPDFVNGSIQTMTLTGDITMNTLGNAIAGRSMTLIITQDGTGNRLLTSSMLFAGASKTLSTAAGAKDIISVFYDGSTYYASLTKGYA